MNTCELSFDVRLDPGEEQYTDPSLETTLNEIRMYLDIIELARKLGIKPKKIAKGKFIEYTEGDNNAYVGDCLRCGGKGCLFLSRTWQQFGCNECHWEGFHERHMDIFQFLTHSLPEEFPNGSSHYDESKRKIQKLFELFPTELAFLAGKDPHRYICSDFFSLAKGYYPGIEDEARNVRERYLSCSRRYYAAHNNIRSLGEDFIQNMNGLDQRFHSMQRIIDAHETVSKIYARRREIDALLSQSVKPEEIGLILDPWIEGDETPEIPEDTFSYEGVDSLPDSSPIGMYFRQKVRDISPSFFEERDFRREPQSTEHYLEIPNASFRSPEIRIDTSLYPREFYRDFVDTYGNMSLPLGGEYSIAYSSVENNFALFLSEPIKRPLGVSHFERWGMEPLELETTIEKVVWNVGDHPGREKPVITLPEGYTQVGEGGWVHTDVGIYFNFSHGSSDFDKRLFDACLKNLKYVNSSRKIYIDKEEYCKFFYAESQRRENLRLAGEYRNRAMYHKQLAR